MLYIEETLGVDATYSDRIDASLQRETLYDYAEQGYDIIVGWGAAIEDDLLEVADEYREIQFVVHPERKQMTRT